MIPNISQHVISKLLLGEPNADLFCGNLPRHRWAQNTSGEGVVERAQSNNPFRTSCRLHHCSRVPGGGNVWKHPPVGGGEEREAFFALTSKARKVADLELPGRIHGGSGWHGPEFGLPFCEDQTVFSLPCVLSRSVFVVVLPLRMGLCSLVCQSVLHVLVCKSHVMSKKGMPVDVLRIWTPEGTPLVLIQRANWERSPTPTKNRRHLTLSSILYPISQASQTSTKLWLPFRPLWCFFLPPSHTGQRSFP